MKPLSKSLPVSVTDNQSVFTEASALTSLQLKYNWLEAVSRAVVEQPTADVTCDTNLSWAVFHAHVEFSKNVCMF